MTSQTFTLTVASGAPQSWFTSLANKQWAAPVTNWLGASGVKDPLADNGNGAHIGIIEEWTGMGCDTQNKTIFLLANGGHSRYFGNEVYSCDLTQASPAWTRRRNATTAPPASGSYTKWADGRPCATHNTALTVAGEGRWFLLGMSGTNFNGGTDYRQWWEYKRTAGGTISGNAEDWVDLGSLTSTSFVGGIKGSALFDPVARQLIVVHGENSQPCIIYQSIDSPNTATTTLRNNSAIGFNDFENCAIDTTNRILFMWSKAPGGADMMRYVSLASNATKSGTIQSVTAPGGTPPPLYNQLHWHAASGAFITWDHNAGVIKKLAPIVSGGAYTGMNAWTSVAYTGTAPVYMSTQAAIYNRIQLIPDMGDGTAALVVVPRYAFPDTYVMRLTGAI